MTTGRKLRMVVAIMGTVSALILPTIALSAEQNANQGINKGVISSLSAEWWRWTLSIPMAVNPLSFNDEAQSAAYCGVGQHGKVWFLGGTLDGSPASRECSIPAGAPIFFPVINAECSSIEGNGGTKEELSACAKDLIDHVTVVEVTVDGIPLKGLRKSRVQSELFTFMLPPGDVLGLYGAAPNPSPSVSDGFWVLLPPLPEGEHQVSIHGVAVFPQPPDPDFVFEQKTDYRINIVPKLP